MYKSNREKAIDYINDTILPYIRKEIYVDYYRTLALISSTCGISESVAEDILKSFINSGKIKENRVLTIPDEQLRECIELIKINKGPISK